MHLLEASTLSEAFTLESRQKLAETALKLMSGMSQLSVKPVNHPLLACFCLSAGFSLSKAAGEGTVVFRIALQSLLPVILPLDSLQVNLCTNRLFDLLSS